MKRISAIIAVAGCTFALGLLPVAAAHADPAGPRAAGAGTLAAGVDPDTDVAADTTGTSAFPGAEVTGASTTAAGSGTGNKGIDDTAWGH